MKIIAQRKKKRRKITRPDRGRFFKQRYRRTDPRNSEINRRKPQTEAQDERECHLDLVKCKRLSFDNGTDSDKGIWGIPSLTGLALQQQLGLHRCDYCLVNNLQRLDWSVLQVHYKNIKKKRKQVNQYGRKLAGETIPVGPLCTLVPECYHQHLSKETLKGYLTASQEAAKELEKKIVPADIPVLTRPYRETVYDHIMNNLTTLGTQAVKDIHPWVLCTLIDLDNFDQIICSNPLHEPNLQPDKKIERSKDGSATVIEASVSNSEGGSGRWSNGAISKLIEVRKSMEPQFNKPSIKKKILWNIIATKINEIPKTGMHVTGLQCEQKWKNLTKAFRDTVDHNSKSGNDPKKCAFFEELQECYGYRPNVKPIYAAGSSSSICGDSSDSTDNCMSKNTTSEVLEPKKKKCKKSDTNMVYKLLAEMKNDFKEEQHQLLETLKKQHDERQETEK